MKAWQKEAIVGAVWGLITGIIVSFIPGFGAVGFLNAIQSSYFLREFPTSIILGLIFFIIFLPAWLGSFITILLFNLGISAYALTPLLSIFFGILIVKTSKRIIQTQSTKGAGK